MSMINELPRIFCSAYEEYKKLNEGSFKTIMESGSEEDATMPGSLLIWSDNRKSLPYLAQEGYAGKVQMIYADPPFFSKSDYKAALKIRCEDGKNKNVKVHAYDDRWGNDISNYINEMVVQLFAMKELLKDDGVIVVHLDWHAVHYARLVMDEIFGADNFINEVIWSYKSGGSSSKRFARKHDNLLIYGKTPQYKFRAIKEKSYNRGFKPYRFKGVEEFQDEKGWYTMVNAKDVWEMDAVGRTSSERVGYATQKPEKLLKRLIEAFTDEGDIVCDMFSGSGTTAAAAVKSGRRWVCGDKNPMSIAMSLSRIAGHDSSYKVIKEEGAASGIGEISAAYENGVLRLTGYTPAPVVDVDSDSLKIVNETAVNSPRDLITYVSLDTDYDGKIHKNRYDMGSADGRMPEEISVQALKGYKIHILAADVFGNFSEREIEI